MRTGEGGEYKVKPSHLMVSRAKELRTNQTEMEKKLWEKLRNNQFGVKFRRQHPIPPYIADFACIERKLLVELDGGQHTEQIEQDKERTACLEKQGWRVLRFWNLELVENFEGVLETIYSVLQEAGRLDFSALSPKAKAVMEIAQDGKIRRAAELSQDAGVSAGVVKTLTKNGYLEEVELLSAAPCRYPDAAREGAKLSEGQQKAADQLKSSCGNGFKPFLLDGVTGAGKTEVYFEAVAQTLQQGGQVLILLPEIALSNAFLDRFKERFGCAPALWHSSLTPAQRRKTWRGVALGESRVVIGARSALFLPYADLGLIIVDEEHDPAYKQEEGLIYNARDMAIVRAKFGDIPIALVSATPSLETMQNVWDGKYEHLTLPDRHGGAQMPDIHLIDMKKDGPDDRQHFIAPKLVDAMAQTMKDGGQALLFLNRRGYAPLTLCRTCGHRFECPRCTAWMIEHKRTGRLHCHHCGYSMKIPDLCPACGDADSLAPCGPGVERIADEVKSIFPDARVRILSSDTATTHEDLKKILDEIREHKIDIIIGTQIIAKGHHFPKLTCVGIIDADLGLSGGDLRATERTYQLLHQVAGRAGREADKGHVYLQSFNPDSRVMQALADNARDIFLEVEAEDRERAFMPPFSRLAGIIVSGRDEDLVIEVSKTLGQSAPQGEGIQTLGPADAPMYRLRGKYRRRLLVRADKKIDLQKALQNWLKNVKVPSTVRVQVDIDPQSFF